MARGHVAGGGLDVAGLVVKKEVGLKLAQKRALVQPAQKHGLVHLDVPVHQGANGALMRRGAARGDQRGAHAHLRLRGLLQSVQRHQQGLERAVGQGQGGFVLFVLLKSVQALVLVDALGLVAKQHRVAVKGDAHFKRVRAAGVGRLRIHLRGGHARVQRAAHVAQVRA